MRTQKGKCVRSTAHRLALRSVWRGRGVCPALAVLDPPPHGRTASRTLTAAASPSRWQCFHAGFHSPPPLFLSRKFLKSLIRKQPQELLLVIGTGVSAAVAPGIPALCSWRSCIEAVIEAAEQLEVLHPGDVAEFRRKLTKDGDLLVVAHDLIRKMSPVSASRSVLPDSLGQLGSRPGW